MSECCLSYTSPRMPTPWHYSEVTLSLLTWKGRHKDGIEDYEIPCTWELFPVNVKEIDREPSFFPCVPVSTRVLLGSVIKSPFLSKEVSWRWHLNHLRDTRVWMCTVQPMVRVQAQLRWMQSELGRDSLRRGWLVRRKLFGRWKGTLRREG